MKDSYDALINIFSDNKSLKEGFKNPRKTYENFMAFIKLFSNNPDVNLLTKTDLKQFLEKFIFSENDKKL